MVASKSRGPRLTALLVVLHAGILVAVARAVGDARLDGHGRVAGVRGRVDGSANVSAKKGMVSIGGPRQTIGLGRGYSHVQHPLYVHAPPRSVGMVARFTMPAASATQNCDASATVLGTNRRRRTPEPAERTATEATTARAEAMTAAAAATACLPVQRQRPWRGCA